MYILLFFQSKENSFCLRLKTNSQKIKHLKEMNLVEMFAVLMIDCKSPR